LWQDDLAARTRGAIRSRQRAIFRLVCIGAGFDPWLC
jgi:hypothetical protein